MAMDGAGTVYITGNALGQIPTTAGALPLSPNATTPPSGAFLAAFFPTLAVQAAQQLAYGTYLDGAGRVGRFFEDSYGVGVDAAGNAYLTGSTACCLNSGPGNPNLPVTPGAFQTAPGGADDAYAVKIGPGPLTSSAAAPAPICTTALTLARGALHLGLIAGARTALQAPYPLGYVTFQNGASSLVLRRPTLTCVGPGLSSAVITLTGPVFSGYGIYQPGDLVTVTVTGSGGAMFAGASYTVEVKVTRGVTTVSDTTLTGVPWSQNGHLVVMPF